PTEYLLYQNYPNPFNPVTNIKYSIITETDVTIKIYDILGNELKTLVDEFQRPGFYNIKLDGSNFSSGVYFYRIIANNFISTKKLILLK
ncbi:MAG TPA: T9SS type A sorting domain-containing protein, partial [Ignavibacteriaceae bacterium]|nr:T9SS type A sorting domain-containing protein [Ignavibacteriaceae bacterium]